jgi:hypothetical protein
MVEIEFGQGQVYLNGKAFFAPGVESLYVMVIMVKDGTRESQDQKWAR